MKENNDETRKTKLSGASQRVAIVRLVATLLLDQTCRCNIYTDVARCELIRVTRYVLSQAQTRCRSSRYYHCALVARGNCNFRPLIFDGLRTSVSVFPSTATASASVRHPFPLSLPLSLHMNGRKVLENAVRSNFCEIRCGIVPPSSSMPSLSPSDLYRSIRRLTKQVVTTGTADPCMSLSTGRSVAARKRATVYLAGVVAVVKKFHSRFSLIPRTTYPVVKTFSCAHANTHTHTHVPRIVQKSLLFSF